jgi:hypothetical protein
MSRRLNGLIAALAIAGLTLQPMLAHAQVAVGNAQKVVRDVKGAVANNTRELVVNDNVYSEERIDTGGDSAARMVFKDQTILSIGANSNVVLDRFVYDPNPANSTVSLSMSKGVMRFVTGNLPKSQYRIQTPTALIGVRGTIVVISVAANGTTTVSVVEGSVSVSAAGSTSIANAGQTVSVSPGAPPGPPQASPPAPSNVAQMDTMLGPDPGTASASLAGEAGAGGLTAGAVALGAAALVGLGVLVSAVTDDDDDAAATSTSTSTSTSAQ